jgi:glycine cleavage system H protein
MLIPNPLKYTKTDEWVKVEGNVATVGVSDYAQEQLSDVVFVEITVTPGNEVKKNSTIATIESVKAAADVVLPVSGKVMTVNESLPDKPELINSDPYEKGWLLKVEISNPEDLVDLMDAKAYESYCQGRGH